MLRIDVDKELQKQLLKERDSKEYRDTYDKEIAFYDMVSNGNYDELVERVNQLKRGDGRLGVLSDNDLQSHKYHSVVMTALVSRFCIEAGMDIHVSYTLSDIYIRLIDKVTSMKELLELNDTIALDYCKRMRDLVKKNVISRHVVIAIDYIRSHIQENLSVETIAEALSLNASYLSKLFKQEMGITLSRYIREKKLEIACNMLRHLDESSLSIANYLGFSSQSHFIQVFKKEMGITPEEYRKNHYHQSWIGDSES